MGKRLVWVPSMSGGGGQCRGVMVSMGSNGETSWCVMKICKCVGCVVFVGHGIVCVVFNAADDQTMIEAQCE